MKRFRGGKSWGNIVGEVEVVLKNGWLDEGSKSEKEIQIAIFATLKCY